MRKIRSLWTRHTCTIHEGSARTEIQRHGKVETELMKILGVYNEKEFCNGLISAVSIATTYHDDIDRRESECKVHGVITNERHSKVTPEELSRKWSIGLQTPKETLKVTTQKGIQMAIHPMTR